MEVVQPRYPGTEARAGKFGGPSLIPALNAIQRRCGWLPRDERIAEAKARYGDDVEVELVEVSCLGRCDIAPAAAVDERPLAFADADEAVEAARGGTHGEPDAKRGGEPLANDPYAAGEERYRVLRRALAGDLGADAIVATLKESQLRGMGGAGFPTGQKWQIVADQTPTPKYTICNADEIEALRSDGLLGDDVLGSGRRLQVEIFTSPGGYILGEESALLECMEGHRGEPRNKPPFPGLYGLWGKPTLMNSVETFADVPIILERGAQWWKDQGVNGATGLKFFAVSGHVERPDVYCVRAGSTARDLIEAAGGVPGGREVAVFQPGGASSNFLGREDLDVPLDWKPLQDAGSMLGSGALIVVAEGTDLLAAGTNVLRFFRNESCGKCVPCRVGSAKAHAMLSELLGQGKGVEDVAGEITQLEETVRKTSICGLGQVALGPVLSVIGMDRGGAAAREHPKDPEDTET